LSSVIILPENVKKIKKLGEETSRRDAEHVVNIKIPTTKQIKLTRTAILGRHKGFFTNR